MNNVILYEELTMNAHPAIQTQLLDGAVLRFAAGYTKRANSVNPLYSSEISNKISYCEYIYTSQGLPTVFKLTPLSFEALDKNLEAKGYNKVEPSNLMTRTIPLEAVSDCNAIVTNKINEEWQESYFRLSGLSDKLIHSAKKLQENILGKTLCALIYVNGIAVACGLCVVEREYAGLFDIIVDPDYRKKGLGFDICCSLLNHAAKLGATTAHLAVVAENAPAVALYNKLGFRNCYQYWYRVKG